MSITTEKKNNFSLLKINQEKLDSTLSPDLKATFVQLNKNGEKNILVDLSDVKYCDSSGLSALLIGNRLCNEQEGNFVINSLQEMVEKMIQISQLDKVLQITKSIEEAEELLA
jgi:anti-sigma B factor antagonist